MGLPRGDERVRGGRAFKGGGAPRLGLGPEAALKVMAHSGPRAGGGHRRGLWVKGARGGGWRWKRVSAGWEWSFGGDNERVRGGLAVEGGGRRASLGIGARGSLESDGALGAASRGGGHRRGLWVKGAGEGLA